MCLTAATAADAQVSGRHRGSASWTEIAYDNGYREGLEHGERDSRSGRDFSFDHDSRYQRGDSGYRSQYGDRDSYRQAFRQGYAAGYNEGYSRSGYGRSGHGRAVPRPNGGYGYPTYPSSPRYPSGQYGYGGPHDTGFADGYEKGIEDARDRDRYDPLRHGRYRSGDRGYDRRYGSREEYKNVYREGFRQGYERGYREARTYGSRNGRWNTNRGGWLGWILP